MNFSLSETVTYQTTLTPNEIYKSIDEVIDPPNIFHVNWVFWGSSKPYEGMIDQYNFKISKIQRGKGVNLVQAEGTFRQEQNHTMVEVRISMPILTKFFGIVWSSIVTLIGESYAAIPFDANLPIIFRFFPVFLFIVAAGIFYGGYKWNANAFKNDLKRILQAEIIEKS